MKRLLLFSAFLVIAGTSSVRAEFRQIDLSIFGMDWAICAHAVSVALQKIQGVESVKVSLNEGLARIRLKPGNQVSLKQMRKAVENNGFTPKDAQVTAQGTLVAVAGRLQFKIAGTQETYELALAPKSQRSEAELKAQVGKTVEIEGLIKAPTAKKAETLLAMNFK